MAFRPASDWSRTYSRRRSKSVVSVRLNHIVTAATKPHLQKDETPLSPSSQLHIHVNLLGILLSECLKIASVPPMPSNSLRHPLLFIPIKVLCLSHELLRSSYLCISPQDSLRDLKSSSSDVEILLEDHRCWSGVVVDYVESAFELDGNGEGGFDGVDDYLCSRSRRVGGGKEDARGRRMGVIGEVEEGVSS